VLNKEVCLKCPNRMHFYPFRNTSGVSWLCPYPEAKKLWEAESKGCVVTDRHVPPAWCERKLQHAISAVYDWQYVDLAELQQKMLDMCFNPGPDDAF
jgi:hypothetical protein